MSREGAYEGELGIATCSYSFPYDHVACEWQSHVMYSNWSVLLFYLIEVVPPAPFPPASFVILTRTLGGTFSLYSLLCRKIGIRPHDVMFRGESRMMRHLGSSSTGGSQLRRTSGSGTRGAGLRASGDGTLRRLSTTPQDTARGPDTTLTLATSASRVAGTVAPHPHPQQPRRVWWRRWAASGTAVRAALRRNRAAQLGLWGMTMAATGMVLGDGVLTPAISGGCGHTRGTRTAGFWWACCHLMLAHSCPGRGRMHTSVHCCQITCTCHVAVTAPAPFLTHSLCARACSHVSCVWSQGGD